MAQLIHNMVAEHASNGNLTIRTCSSIRHVQYSFLLSMTNEWAQKLEEPRKEAETRLEDSLSGGVRQSELPSLGENKRRRGGSSCLRLPRYDFDPIAPRWRKIIQTWVWMWRDSPCCICVQKNEVFEVKYTACYATSWSICSWIFSRCRKNLYSSSWENSRRIRFAWKR